MEINIIRSPNRRKTIHARMKGETLEVLLPVGLTIEKEKNIITEITDKIEKQKQKRRINSDEYLVKRFQKLNDEYFQGKLKITSILFVTNQKRVNGSCTPTRGTIRLSHKLLEMPSWVLDYVIMHEMTHLLYPNHSREFWNKVAEYRLTERARGFLMAKGMER